MSIYFSDFAIQNWHTFSSFFGTQTVVVWKISEKSYKRTKKHHICCPCDFCSEALLKLCMKKKRQIIYICWSSQIKC